MGDEELKKISKTYGHGYGNRGGGYLPNVGKKYIDTAVV